MNSTVRIDVWSDIVCPFCYVGKKKLERAIEHLGFRNQVHIVWHSFQLDPYMPRNLAVPTAIHLCRTKRWDPAQFVAMTGRVQQLAAPYGIHFHFDKALSFNTRDAHRLLHWSKEHNAQNELQEAFMHAYFTEGRDLARKDTLLNIVEEVSLPVAEARAVLESEAYEEAVEEDLYRARMLGIQGVPFFLIDEKEVIAGAQKDSLFELVLKTALQSKRETPVQAGADIQEDKQCGIDSKSC